MATAATAPATSPATAPNSGAERRREVAAAGRSWEAGLTMSFHHTAFATHDPGATHAFYTEAMGFELVKVEVAPTPKGGWAKHFFYDTGGGQLMAFWDLHDESIPDGWSSAISTGLGLPEWVNHLAFAASDLDDLETRKLRLLDAGRDVVEIDHGWCSSIYANDPNGIVVEFCTTTRAFTEADREEARRLFADPNPPVKAPPEPKFFLARDRAGATR
jgi:catechol 2,3-dioxygenase-like lactoylglutathione lyase family enzyme